VWLESDSPHPDRRLNKKILISDPIHELDSILKGKQNITRTDELISNTISFISYNKKCNLTCGPKKINSVFSVITLRVIFGIVWIIDAVLKWLPGFNTGFVEDINATGKT
jgi:hypothetical protein